MYQSITDRRFNILVTTATKQRDIAILKTADFRGQSGESPDSTMFFSSISIYCFRLHMFVYYRGIQALYVLIT